MCVSRQVLCVFCTSVCFVCVLCMHVCVLRVVCVQFVMCNVCVCVCVCVQRASAAVVPMGVGSDACHSNTVLSGRFQLSK